MGRALLPAPFFATVVLGGLTVLDAGSDDQKRNILTGVCAGTVRLTLALTEPSATTEAWGVETQASASGDGYSISGTKLFVPDAHAADTIIVAARTMPASSSHSGESRNPEQGITLFLVPSNAAGLDVEQISTIGNERLCEVRLNGVVGGFGRRAGRGWSGLAGHRADAGPGHRGPLCADGGRRRGGGRYDRGIRQAAHAVRPAGGQLPGGAAPLRQHGHRRRGERATWPTRRPGPWPRASPPAARSPSPRPWCSGAYQRVCSLGHQCHGAIGFTQEHNLQLYTRRAKVQELSYGSVHDHKEVALQEIEAG